jgi:hypothetical protein
LGDSLIACKSEKQQTISKYFVEAKHGSITSTCCKIMWLFSLLRDLHISHLKASLLFCDSQAALRIVANHVYHERTKYIEIDCYLIQEKIK